MCPGPFNHDHNWLCRRGNCLGSTVLRFHQILRMVEQMGQYPGEPLQQERSKICMANGPTMVEQLPALCRMGRIFWLFAHNFCAVFSDLLANEGHTRRGGCRLHWGES